MFFEILVVGAVTFVAVMVNDYTQLGGAEWSLRGEEI